MKSLKTIFFIMFIAIQFCNAQETTEKYIVKADSVQKLLSKHNAQDQQKVALLNEFARFSNHSLDFKKGLIAAKQAKELSKKLNYINGEVQYYQTMEDLFRDDILSFYYRKQADWLSLEKESVLNQNSKKLTWPTNLNHKKVLAQLSNALLYFEQVKDKEIQANIQILLAWSNSQLEKPKEAKINIQNSLSLFKELNEAYPVFLLSSYQMINFKNDGKAEEAHNMEIDLVKFISTIKDKKLLALLSLPMADSYSNSGQFSLAIEYYLKSATALEEDIRREDKDLLDNIYVSIAGQYEGMNNHSKALEYFTKRERLFKEMNDTIKIYDAYGTKVFPLIQLKRYKEARKYMALALQEPNKELANYKLARNNDANGQIEMMQGNYEAAIPFFNNAIDLFKKGYIQITPFIYCYLSECYQKLNNLPKAIDNGLQAYNLTKSYRNKRIELKSSLLLSRIYEQKGQKDDAFKFLKIYQELKDVSDDLDANNRLANNEIQSILEKSKQEIEKIDKQRLEKESQNKNQRWWIFTIAAALFSTMVLLFILYRNNKNKEKANNLLSKQKEEINIQKNKVEQTLTELKSTQAQLIQSEKMASLGELTAGIAHEIQNPLNFVNNFSEVSKELAEELKEESQKPEIDKGLIAEIATDIADNQTKIHHHGNRASSIVKGMLEHSRTSYGKKELTDINTLADEYLRLSYHGLRAKNKDFNAEMVTDFDPNLPKIEVIPQDTGRVLLNLINNAFQAVDEQSKKGIQGYKPTVTVSTKYLAPSPPERAGAVRRFGEVEVTITDNGPGISDEIKDKIFQPFFTTKDTGKGTGLGLSLAYDIVKAHGGELTVDSTDGEGSAFIINLPLKA
jgi:two-component system NtrC family sensor kinase